MMRKVHEMPLASADKYPMEACHRLVAAIMRRNGRVPPDYLRTPCGRWWASVSGLEPQLLWETAVKDTYRESERYKPISRCTCSNTEKKLRAMFPPVIRA